MRSLLVTNIGELVTGDPAYGEGPLGIRRRAALVIEDRRVEWVGRAEYAPAADSMLNADGAAVLPGFVDSHSHLVFAGDRAAEFSARMAGEPYTGGGIRTTVGATRAASDAQLRETAGRLRREALRQGTTTMEIKSGYGLNVADEARTLRVARELTAETTFLGAHVLPPEYSDRPDDYVSLVCGPMLAAARPHAKWIDVFCEEGAFDEDHSRAILTVGAAAGLGVRVHANQLGPGPGVRLAVELGAASADHCTHLSSDDIAALAGSNTVATLLPGADFSTRSPYPPARALLDAGATIALATDCNPGSSFTTSMPFCVALAVREMGLAPWEAVAAATTGGAQALRLPDAGRLTRGSRGDLMVLDAPSYLHLAYRPGVPIVSTVVLNGELT